MGDFNKERGIYLEESFEYLGAMCLIIANRTGNRCGYVGVKNSHPLWGIDYDNIHGVDAHGGLTFSGKWDGYEEYWFIGFDCAHMNDAYDVEIIKNYFPEKLEEFNKMMDIMSSCSQGTVKTLKYVRQWCIKIAQNIMFFN